VTSRTRGKKVERTRGGRTRFAKRSNDNASQLARRGKTVRQLSGVEWRQRGPRGGEVESKTQSEESETNCTHKG